MRDTTEEHRNAEAVSDPMSLHNSPKAELAFTK